MGRCLVSDYKVKWEGSKGILYTKSPPCEAHQNSFSLVRRESLLPIAMLGPNETSIYPHPALIPVFIHYCLKSDLTPRLLKSLSVNTHSPFHLSFFFLQCKGCEEAS